MFAGTASMGSAEEDSGVVVDFRSSVALIVFSDMLLEAALEPQRSDGWDGRGVRSERIGGRCELVSRGYHVKRQVACRSRVSGEWRFW